VSPRFAAPIGRYVLLELDGVPHRIYVEEAGTGVPLLLQHTAGSHGSQWRHIFEDRWITDRFHVLAYDMPFHGKSLPPIGPTWWAEEYKLTTERAMAVPLAVADAYEFEQPVFAGCSIGGALALDLARWHGERFRAVVAIEPALKIDIDPDALRGFWHPRVSNEFKAAMMFGLMAPTSPEAYRREAVFCYSQGWPPGFSGDLHYYAFDHDLREEAAGIDTRRCAVRLLTGEYDYSATVEHGRAAHEAIAGSTFTVMSGLGHFPMVENPDLFLPHLRAVLAEILELEVTAEAEEPA
jgi:pimeloyl-ACP methyl ester carboxylesterase